MKANLPIIIFGGIAILALVIFIIMRSRETDEEPENETPVSSKNSDDDSGRE